MVFEKAWRFLKASRQMKLYNYIEDYPGKEPVTAYRGVPFPTTQPMDATRWYQKDTPINLNRKGTWWAEGGAEPHATASFFARMPDEPGPDNERAIVLGHRGKLENIGDVQRRRNEWNPANDAKMDEAFISHDRPIDWENIVLSQPTKSVTDDMGEEEHDKWLENFYSTTGRRRQDGVQFPPFPKEWRFDE